MADPNERFREDQQRFFQTADERHFRWQTTNPYVARTERDLLRGFPIASGTRILEVGCGEGGNLTNLLRRDLPHSSVVGVDLFEQKVAFASKADIPAIFVCGDALDLPFKDSAFDLVLCRDVLHHVQNRERALHELRRVCRPGGVVWIVEPNGRNPLMWLLAVIRPHERGLLKNSTVSLRRLVTPVFPKATYTARQPMPIYRALLHYQFGLPALGTYQLFARGMDAWDALARRLVPQSLWSYVIIAADA